MSTFMFKFLNHDLRLLKFNKPLHFFAEMPLYRKDGTFPRQYTTAMIWKVGSPAVRHFYVFYITDLNPAVF